MDFLEKAIDLITMIGNGISNVIDLFLNLPSLMMDLIEIIPNPLGGIVGAFIGAIICLILLKVVKHLVT